MVNDSHGRNLQLALSRLKLFQFRFSSRSPRQLQPPEAPLPFALLFRRAQLFNGPGPRRVGALGLEGGTQQPMTFESLDEIIGVDDRAGDFAEHGCVDLDLAV